jgi:alpha-1,3-rhamnosyl/mannosyltransferase
VGPHEVERLGRGGEHELDARGALEEELELAGLIEREAFDLLHAPSFHLPALMPCSAVITIHDAIPLVRPELASPGLALVFESAHGAARRADAVVCPSASAKLDVVRGLGLAPAKVHVIPEAPDEVFRPATAEDQARVRREYELGDAEFVLFVGALERRKNPGVVLEALARLGREAPVAVFAGIDAGFDLGDEASRLGVFVTALGVVPDADLAALYSAALCLIFPSHYEGFGLPVVEAFACGCPVVASNRASIPEVAGDAARLFDPLDPDALAREVRALVRSPELRAELALRGSARLARFGPDDVRRGFRALYDALEGRIA